MRAGSPDKGFWIGLAAGTPIMVYGVRGLVGHLPGVQLSSFAVWFVGAAVVHDLLLGPLVGAIGWILLRTVPRVAVAPVQIALIASGIVALVSWPFVRAYGITPGEPSFLSRNYTASVLIVWTLVWALAALAVFRRVLIARRR